MRAECSLLDRLGTEERLKTDKKKSPGSKVYISFLTSEFAQRDSETTGSPFNAFERVLERRRLRTLFAAHIQYVLNFLTCTSHWSRRALMR